MRNIKSSILSQNYYVLLNEKEKKETKKGRKIHSSILGHAGDKSSISGLTYVGGKLLAGIGGTFEGAADFIGGLFGSDEYEEYLYIYDTPIQDFHESLDKAYDPGKVGRFVGDVASGLGQSATFLIPYAGQAIFFTGVMGNSVSSAAQKTGKVGFKEYAYGAGSAAMEWALERYIGGTGQTLESLTKKGAHNLGTKLTKSVGKTAAKKTAGKMIASQLISSSVGEGVEEFFGNVGDYALLHVTGVDSNATFDWGDAIYSFFVGATSGALMGGVTTATQTAYETKSGSEINQNDKRREIMLKEAREIVTKGKNLSGGSDAVATHLSTIEAMLKAYDGAADKKSNTANLALGKINSALISAEFNIITDRHAEFVAANATKELADYATDLFREATGERVTVDMLRDINNQYTRALATMDWAGNVVRGIVGADAKLTAEMADAIEKELAGKQAAADKKAQADAYQKDFAEKTKDAKEVSEASSWNGEAVTYRATINGEEAYLAIRPEEDGTYSASMYSGGKRHDLPSLSHLPMESVKEILSDASQNKITNDAAAESAESEKNAAEANKRSKEEQTDTQDEKTAESAEKQGETSEEAVKEESGSEEKRKLSLGEERARKKITRGMSEQERYEILKDRIIPLTAKTDVERIAKIEERHDLKQDSYISMQLRDKKTLFKKIGEEFGVFRKYENEDIQLEFEYTRGGMDEGTQKQLKNYPDYLKMLSCFDKVIENAVGIEVHNRNAEGYKKDPTLKDVRVLVSAFEDGENVIPVKLEIKEFTDKENKLYVAITLESIKKEEIVTQGDTAQSSVTQDAPSSVISIAQLFEKINPQEKNFTKYIPDSFLTLEQKAVKHEESGKKSMREEPEKADAAEEAPLAEDAKERAQAVKETLLSEEGIIGSEEEVKRATKLVKDFKLLAASERNAIIRMMRSGSGIEKATLSSLAHLIAIRPGLNVLFVSGTEGEGSHTELSDGARLILLDPTLKNGKKYRSDVIFHELYHDMASTGEISTLTDAVVKSSPSAFIRKIADRYTGHNNGESISKWLNGRAYTKANFNAYFEEHKGISRATVEEEIAASCMAKVMGSSRFIKEYGGNVGSIRRIYYGLTRTARAIANRSVELDGEVDGGFTLTFRDVLEYKKAYEVALLASQYQMSAKDLTKLSQLMQDRDEEDVERAKSKLAIREDIGDSFDADTFFAEELKKHESQTNNALTAMNQYLESKGFAKKDIDAHGSVFAPEEEDVAESRASREGVKAYTKKEVAKTLEDAIINVLQPIVGGDIILKGKKKKALISELFSRMNGAKPSERTKIARKLASEVLAMAVYDDYEINAEYETMLTDGTIENLAAVKSYIGKISAKHVQSEIYHRVGKKQGNVILRRWANAENGISVHDALLELQSEGMLADLDDKANEADLILRLNAEYEHLKERSEMRRELVPLAALDPEEYKRSLDGMTAAITSLFEDGGRETKYGKVIRRYRELLGERDAKHQKELDELRAKLTNEMEKRIKRIHEDAEHSREYWKERAGDARMGRDDARVTAQLVVAVKGLREFLNRDYTPASEGQDKMNKNIARLCTKAVNRTKVHAAPAVEAAHIVKEWADAMKKEDSNFVGDTVFHSTITTAQYEAISRLAAIEVKEGTQLTIDQKKDLLTLIYVIKHAYNHQKEVFKAGKWVGIEEYARRAVENATKLDADGGKFKKALQKMGKLLKKGALMYMDPLSIAAHMDGYTYDGPMQEFMEEVAFAEARANVMMKQLREPFEAFLEGHKKYAKRLAEEKITLKNGLEITVGQAITLSEMFKRDQAKAGLMLSRIGFRFDDGTSKEIEGFGKQSFVKTPNGSQMKVEDATEMLFSWKKDRLPGIRQLKELGYNTDGDKNINDAFADFEKRVEAAESQAQRFIDEFGQSREGLIKSMEKQFTAEDKQFVQIVSNFFNKTSKKVKTDADMKNLGYTNVIEGYYFPIKRMKADMDQSISSGEWFSEFITAENLSFNKKTIEGAKASIEIFNVWNVVSDHIQGLSRWEHLYLPIQNLNKIYNYNTSDSHTNVVSLKNTLEKREDFNYHAFLSDLMLDVQGARKRETQTALDKGVNKLRSGYAVYQLGLNPKTIAKQILSLAAAGQFASIKNIAKGVKIKNADKMNQYSVMAAEREDNATVVRAYSNTEKVSKAMEFTTKGISWMDRNVNLMLWSIAQNQIEQTQPDVQVGSEKYFQLAGELTDEMILFVQDSSDAMTKSQAARSSSEIVKGTTMFASSALKMFSRIIENVGFLKNYRSLNKENQAKYAQKYSRAKKQLARSVGSMAAVAVMTALISRLFSFLYNDDRNQEEETVGEVAKGVGMDALSEVFGFIPVIGDAAGYFMDGYDVSNFYYDSYNDLLVAVSDTYTLLGKVASGEVIEEWEIGRMLRKNARALGSLSGIPVRNVENTLSGLVRRFLPETGYAYDTLFYNAQYTADINKALQKGDAELASSILELALKRNKTGSVYSFDVLDTIVKLHNEGYTVLPRDINTDKVSTRKKYAAFEKIYSQADEAVEALVKSAEFAALADYSTEDGNAQAMAINTVFSAYYEIAEHEVLGKELSKKAAVFTVSENPTQLLLVKAYEKALSMGAVETTLTKKKALLKYMRDLNMDKTSQAWAAWLCGYRTEDVLSLIERDLAGKDNEKELRLALGIDKEEKEAA